MVRGSPTKPTKVGADKRYLRKARKFFDGCKSEHDKENWDACGVLAVHVAISACDAICARLLQVRSSGADHIDAVRLFTQLPLDKQELNAKVKQLERVIQMKNAAEYEDRELKESEARDMLRDAGRFLEWVETKFK